MRSIRRNTQESFKHVQKKNQIKLEIIFLWDTASRQIVFNFNALFKVRGFKLLKRNYFFINKLCLIALTEKSSSWTKLSIFLYNQLCPHCTLLTKSLPLHEIVFLKLKLDLRGGSCIIFTISIISLADALFLFHKILIAVNLETVRSVSGRAHFNTLGLTVFFGLNP